MSGNNNGVLIGGALLLYLYMQRENSAAGVVARPGGVASMPGSAGTGLSQMASGAIAGFFKQIAASPSNNTSAPRLPDARAGTPFYDPYPRGDIVNEAVPDYGVAYDDSSYYGGGFE